MDEKDLEAWTGFAKAALTALCARRFEGPESVGLVAKATCLFADAMMAEWKKRKLGI